MMQDSRLEGGAVVREGGRLDKGQETHYGGLESGSGSCGVVKGSVWF